MQSANFSIDITRVTIIDKSLLHEFFLGSIIVLCLVSCCNIAAAQTDQHNAGAWQEYINSISNSAKWTQHVTWSINQLISCEKAIDDRSPCNYFVGRALDSIYDIKDFKTGEDKWFSANQIESFVKQHTEKWKLIGNGNDQNALAQAQADANSGAALIAVSEGSSHGHVALILGGTLKKSDKLNLYMPNSASMFLDKPSASYIGKHLGFAFSDPSKVKIYVNICSAVRLFLDCQINNQNTQNTLNTPSNLRIIN